MAKRQGSESPSTQWADDVSSAVHQNLTGTVKLWKKARTMASTSAGRPPVSAPAADPVTAWLSFGAKAYKAYSSNALAYWNVVLGAADDALGESGARVAAHAVSIALEAAPGNSASTSFLVENPYADRVSVHFDATPPTDDEGDELDPDAVSFEPETLRLLPDAHATVKVTVHLPATVKPGAVYRCAIETIGVPAALIPLAITVRAAATKS